MKKILKVLPIFILTIILTSCEDEDATLNNSNALSGICSYFITSDNESNLVEIGETKTFSISDEVPDTTDLKWSIIEGTNIEIVGSTTSRSFTVKINDGFTKGKIRIETNYQSDCVKEFSVELKK